MLKQKVEAKNKPETIVARSVREKVDYAEHWKGMPEFNQPDLTPIHQIHVCFQNKENMHKFSKLVGQQVTAKTRSIWFPEIEETAYMDKRWAAKKK